MSIRTILVSLVALVCTAGADAQQVPYGIAASSIDELERAAIETLGERVLEVSAGTALPDLIRRVNAEIATADYVRAAETLAAVRSALPANDAERWLPFGLYANARAAAASARRDFDAAYRESFRALAAALDDVAAVRILYWFGANVPAARADVDRLLAAHSGADTITIGDAERLLRAWVFHEVFASSAPLVAALTAEDDARRYLIDADVLIETPQDVTLSAVVVRPRVAARVPTALNFTIYTDLANHLQVAKSAAARGYAGIVVDARGKRLSPDAPLPYEAEVDDTWAAIDWAAKQSWSDGQVGMFGGSYEGFTAWAATKRLHPALKTIATSAAAIPGFGLPMENNVFLNANYGWAFYVTNNKLLDHSQNDGARWAARNQVWFESGRPYRELDQLDGGPNPWLQRWLRHPAYDEYWQAMVPYGEDFARIDIPVLTITGYYDDGQISAIHYTKEHYRHNPDAEHYVVIGPYDHFGSHAPVKSTVLRGYAIDSVAQFSTPALEFEWLDHVMRGGPKPALLRDRINYQVMGANTWRHAPSLDAMSEERWTLYLTDERADGRRVLSPDRPAAAGTIEQTVDFADRTTTGAGYYPSPIVNAAPDYSRGLVFMTEPLDAPIELSGAFSGELGIETNKRDLDVVLVLQELQPDGTAMPLTYYIGRASYTDDMSKRALLTPGESARIAFDRTRVVSRRIEAGSRLVLILDVLKDGFHQINYGTGGDVSDESIADAREPLRVQWSTDSFVRLPITKVREP
jgi:putative CocE/NonD family hydrolase